jgi:hypothetical protein
VHMPSRITWFGMAPSGRHSSDQAARTSGDFDVTEGPGLDGAVRVTAAHPLAHGE